MKNIILCGLILVVNINCFAQRPQTHITEKIKDTVITNPPEIPDTEDFRVFTIWGKLKNVELCEMYMTSTMVYSDNPTKENVRYYAVRFFDAAIDDYYFFQVPYHEGMHFYLYLTNAQSVVDMASTGVFIELTKLTTVNLDIEFEEHPDKDKEYHVFTNANKDDGSYIVYSSYLTAIERKNMRAKYK